MPLFITQGRFTTQAVRGMMATPENREEALRELIDLRVGEFLVGKVAKITQWMDRVGPAVKAYDVPLLHNFSKLSLAKSKLDIDLRKVFRNTLVSLRPDNAVVSF